MSMRERRQALGLLQEELAKAMGISQAYISMIETGDRPITKRVENLLKAIEKSDPKVA